MSMGAHEHGEASTAGAYLPSDFGELRVLSCGTAMQGTAEALLAEQWHEAQKRICDMPSQCNALLCKDDLKALQSVLSGWQPGNELRDALQAVGKKLEAATETADEALKDVLFDLAAAVHAGSRLFISQPAAKWPAANDNQQSLFQQIERSVSRVPVKEQQAFLRELAKRYHPDRNPGREVEVLPAFLHVQYLRNMKAHDQIGRCAWLPGMASGAIDAILRSELNVNDHMSSCNARLPQAFTCRGMPEWAVFLDAVAANARKDFPRDEALLLQAQEILLAWQEKPYPPQDFFKYLCTGPEAPWPLPDRFCLWGFVAALVIRSRHLMASQDPDVRKSAEIDFKYATTVLGKEGSMDFLDSSPWPVSIIDAFININQTDASLAGPQGPKLQFQLTWRMGCASWALTWCLNAFDSFRSVVLLWSSCYTAYNATHPVQPPRVALESLCWRPKSPLPSAVLPANVRLAVLGTHATLSLEPVEMLRRFSGVPVTAVFYGIEPRFCDLMSMCDQGSAALVQLFKDAEKDPYTFPWSKLSEVLAKLLVQDEGLRAAEALLCTEPLAGCLMLRDLAEQAGRRLPLLGYLGVALLNSCPPDDTDLFWDSLIHVMDSPDLAEIAVNNLILSEQVYYQTGYRMPYVRAHGLYTGMAYAPSKLQNVLVWRAPLFSYVTTRCAVMHFIAANPGLNIDFRFMEEGESLPYAEVATFKAVALIPWDHALMTFYELYSANIPLLMPGTEWMYRLLYQRGQLSVGERLYQAGLPGYAPPFVEFAEADATPSPPSAATGLSSAKAARGVAEDVLSRGLEAADLETAKQIGLWQYLKAALDLMKDMRYFLAVAENKTDEDSSTSMGVVRRSTSEGSRKPRQAIRTRRETPTHPDLWHPYTPFQMSPVDSNDWTRMRKGTWWLRRGARFDAMRYWYQYSDFARFPGINYFANLPDLLCVSRSLDVHDASAKMRRYNEESLVHSVSFWTYSLSKLLAK
eukprot:s1310_g13.t18